MHPIIENILIISALSAAFIIFFILIKKFLWKKFSAWASCAIWILLLLRLLIPIQINGPHSIISIDSPDTTTVNMAAEEALELSTIDEQQREVTVADYNDSTVPTVDENSIAVSHEPEAIQDGSIRNKTNISMISLVFYVYLAGVFILIFRLVLQQSRLRRQIKTYKKVLNCEINKIIEKEKSKLGIKRKIIVLESSRINSPSTTGLFRPKILLPSYIVNKSARKQIEYIVIHELMHIKGKDIFKLLLLEVVYCIHWFNIVLHLVKPIIGQDIECACDERVLKIIGPNSYKEYGNVLFDISTRESKKRLGLISAYMAGRSKKKLKKRLLLIKNYSGKQILISSLALLVCLCLTLVACTSSFNKRSIYVDDEADDSPLKVYIMHWDYFEREAIDGFNSRIETGHADGRKIEVTEFESDQYIEMYERIKNEILTGVGPDIIFIDDMFCYSNDFVKMAQQNAFADMDILAESSDAFNYDDYNDMVMQAGIINGKRSFMPVSYSVPYIFSTQQVLSDNNLQIPEEPKLESLLNMVTEYEQSNPQKWYGINDIIWEDILSTNDPTYNLDSDVLEKSINRLQQIYMHNDNTILSSNDRTEIFKANELLYIEPDGNRSSEYLYFAGQYHQSKINGNDVVFFNMPCDADGNSKANINYAVSININSKHKNDAFKFVEYMLSYEVAVSATDGGDITLPVNKRAYEYFKSSFTTSIVNIFDGSGPLTERMPNELAQQCIDIVESPTVCEFNGQALYILNNIIARIQYDYYVGKIDYDTMISQIKSKLELYLSE